MINGSCHCGAVSFALDDEPALLTDCNCSICRRIGALWAHTAIENVQIKTGKDATIAYVQGDKKLAIHSCRVCGCTTHWENLAPEVSGHMAVNCRMVEPESISGIQVRRFDGADTWEYLD